MSLLVLSASDVNGVISTLSPDELMTLMASVFISLSSGQGVCSPHRTSIQMNDHKALFMPSRIDGVGTVMKAVSVPTSVDAAHMGLPASTIVMDEVTGSVKAIVNARSLTAIRTAAGSLLATHLLGPKQPHKLVVFGAGGQIEAHVDLHLRAYPSITTCIIINRTENERLTNLIGTLGSRHPARVAFQGIASHQHNQEIIGQHLLEADVICTATSSHSPLFDASFVRKGAHINLIGSYTPTMLEVDTDVIRSAGKIAVDSRAACLLEAGELIRAGVDGTGLVELGELASINGDGNVVKAEGKCASVKAAGDITIFKSVGVGLQDVAIANLVVNRAEQMGIGINIGSYDVLL